MQWMYTSPCDLASALQWTSIVTFCIPAVSKQIGYESSSICFYFYFLFTNSMDLLMIEASFYKEEGDTMFILLWVRLGTYRSQAFYCIFTVLRFYKLGSPLLASGYELLRKTNCISLLVCLSKWKTAFWYVLF